MTEPSAVHTTRLELGDVEITVVCQGWAPLNLANECPDHEVDWDAQRTAYPWMFADGERWQWHVHGFAVRTATDLVMVDVGLGGTPPYAPWAPGQGQTAVDAYANAGVDPPEVSTVVLTHLHPDHCGGVVEGSEPRFPSARHVLHRDDWDFFHGAEPLDDYTMMAAPGLERVHKFGLLDTDPADREVCPGIRVRHTPGHTPGHRSVLVSTRHGTVLLTGDLLHLPVQVEHAEWLSSHDEDAEAGSRSRMSLLADAETGGWLVGIHHFAEPFGTVSDGRWSGHARRTGS